MMESRHNRMIGNVARRRANIRTKARREVEPETMLLRVIVPCVCFIQAKPKGKP